jgi:hypothetical protein
MTMADAPIDTPISTEPPTPAPVQDTPSADGGGGGSWMDTVPEAYREAGFVTKYPSQEEFFKGMDNLSKFAGQKSQGLMAPGEGATEEELAAFNASLRELSGVPGSLEDYQGALQLPELGEGAMMPKFIEMGFNNGVAPKAMQGIISGLSEELAKEEEAAIKAYDADLQKNMDVLKQDWKDDFDYRLNVAERFASELSPETMEMLNNARWTEKAPLVRDLFALGNKYLTEGDLAQVPRVQVGGGTPTMAGLVAMKDDPRYSDPDLRDDNYTNQVHEYAKRLTAYQSENKQ